VPTSVSASMAAEQKITIAPVARDQKYEKVLIGLTDTLPHLPGDIDDSLPG